MCSDVHEFEEINNLSKNIFERIFYRDESKKRHRLVPVEFTKYISNRVVALVFNENRYVLNKNFDVFLGKHDSEYVCRRCLSWYSSQNVLIKYKQKCNQQKITRIITSNESQCHWEKEFHKNLFFFSVYADFEADIENDNSCKVDKLTNIYKKTPVCNGF